MSAQQVAPTRMALQMYKGKLLGAKKGYELLKKKSDALKVGLPYLLEMPTIFTCRTGTYRGPERACYMELCGRHPSSAGWCTSLSEANLVPAESPIYTSIVIRRSQRSPKCILVWKRERSNLISYCSYQLVHRLRQHATHDACPTLPSHGHGPSRRPRLRSSLLVRPDFATSRSRSTS